jgi:hypothetical protein
MTIIATPDVRAVLAHLFAQSGGPLEVDSVVSRIAASQHGRDEMREVRDESAASHPTGSEELENRQSLRRLWSEIGELPLNQRVALLLHARDTAGESVLRLLPVTGVATIRQIAETLLMQPPALAERWHALPLDDNTIAAILQLTRQQVINLRRSARDRLTRRLQKPATQRRSQ